ncbi:YciI family protein [Hymenobacter sp.]|uniref:YciI family protein n=1 Tax=Hymenobacter sp. TaxID=1898978 RepID=UPI00286A8849|nr:YciI family protein [Hymenobacter sp.]
MSEFLLVFRRDYQTPGLQPNPEQLQEHLKHWADWFRSLAAQNKLANTVQRYDSQGKFLSCHDVTSGPFTASGNSVGNLILLRARDYQEAVALAQGCPILDLGGTVEIRQIVQLPV